MSAVPPWAHPLWWGWQLRTPRLAACWGWRPRAHPPRAPPGLMVLLKRQAGLEPDPLQVKIYGGIWESASVKVLSQLLNSREGAGGQQHHGTAMQGGAPLTAPADDGDHSWGPPGEGGSARTPLSWVGTQCSGGIQAHAERGWNASGQPLGLAGSPLGVSPSAAAPGTVLCSCGCSLSSALGCFAAFS